MQIRGQRVEKVLDFVILSSHYGHSASYMGVLERKECGYVLRVSQMVDEMYRKMKDEGNGPEEIFVRIMYLRYEDRIKTIMNVFNLSGDDAHAVAKNALSQLFRKYLVMKEQGATPLEVYLEAKKDGHPFHIYIDIAGYVFNLTFFEAKDIVVQGDRVAVNLEDYQRKVWKMIEPLLNNMDEVELDEDQDINL